MSPSTQTPSSVRAGRTLADLILSSADARAFFAWAETVELGTVVIDGEPWEPIPVPEVSDSDFAAFDEATR